MLLTLFYIFLLGWIAGVIHFFNIGVWNWALLGAAVIFLAVHIGLVKWKQARTVKRAVQATAEDTRAKPAA